MDNIYDVSKYTDAELYQILDVPPSVSDRELEAVLWNNIHKYEQVNHESGYLLCRFFRRVYQRWFDVSEDDSEEEDASDEEEPLREGFTATSSVQSNRGGQYQTWGQVADTANSQSGTYTYNPNLLPVYGNTVTQQTGGIQTANVGKMDTLTVNPNAIYENMQLILNMLSQSLPSTRMMGYQAPVPTAPNDISITKQVDYSKDNLNPLLKQTIKRIISIDSQYRQNKQSSSTSFTFNLSEPLRDVVSLKLYSIQIPYTWYTVNGSFGSNFFYIKGTTAGIDNGSHDYKVEIPSGNYGPNDLITAINASIHRELMNTRAMMDVSFGQTQVVYNTNQATCDLKLDITDVYNQSFYQVAFPRWTSNPKQSLAGYLGFSRGGVNQQPLSLLSTAIYSVDYTSANVPTDITIGNDNSAVTFVSYRGTSLANATLKHEYAIALDMKTYASSADLVASVNAKMTASNYFDMLYSGLSLITDTNGLTYYQWKIKFDKHYTSNDVSLNYAIQFPQTTASQTVWYGTHSVFQFLSRVNECNNAVSMNVVNAWTNSTQSTYYINTSIPNYLYLKFECVLSEYNNGSNDYVVPMIDTNTADMYSLEGILTHVNGQIDKLSRIDKTNCIGNDDLNTANQLTKMYIADNALNMDVKINRTFTNVHYTFDCSLFDLSFGGYSYMYPSTVSPGSSRPYDLSTTFVFVFDIPVDGTAPHSLNDQYITLTPKNTTNPIILVPLFSEGHAGGSVDVMISDIGYNVFAFQTKNRFIFTNSTYIADGGLINLGTNQNPFYIKRATLTVSVNLTLTAEDYRLYFEDTHMAYDPFKNFWKYKMHIYPYYDMQMNLSYNDTESMTALPNVTFGRNIHNNLVTTISRISDLSNNNQVTLNSTNNYVEFVSYPTDGLIGSVAETIRIILPAGSYHYGTLLKEINDLLDQNPITKGSNLIYQTTLDTSYPQYTVDDAKYYTADPLYVAFRICVNQVYRTNDYRLVFYDPYSFVSCYTGATHVGSRAVQNVTWDTTIGWLLGFRDNTTYDLSVGYNPETNQTVLTSDTCISMNLYNYFLIMLDDYTQNHLNDGLVTITMQETAIEEPMTTEYVCNPATGTMVVKSQANMTQSQIYADNQKLISRSAQKRAAQKSYSNGPFVKDIFGLIPIKTSGFTPGSVYVEFGGTLQNQERTYFGPVNIHRMTIKLLTDRGDLVDLNNANWSFSFVCETLYRSKN
jgi:hypothetical protein